MEVKYLSKPDMILARDNAHIRMSFGKGVYKGVSFYKFTVVAKDTPSGTLGTIKTINVKREDTEQDREQAYKRAMVKVDDYINQWKQNYAETDYTLVVFAPPSYKTVVESRQRRASPNQKQTAPLTGVDAELLDVFGNMLRFKAMIKRVAKHKSNGDLSKGLQFLKEITSEIQHITDALESEWNEEIKQAQVKKERAAEIAAMMLEAGITVDDLANAPKPKRQTKPKEVEPKYQVIHQGQPIEWNGCGKTPTPFVEHMQQTGKSLEQLRVN